MVATKLKCPIDMHASYLYEHPNFCVSRKKNAMKNHIHLDFLSRIFETCKKTFLTKCRVMPI